MSYISAEHVHPLPVLYRGRVSAGETHTSSHTSHHIHRTLVFHLCGSPVEVEHTPKLVSGSRCLTHHARSPSQQQDMQTARLWSCGRGWGGLHHLLHDAERQAADATSCKLQPLPVYSRFRRCVKVNLCPLRTPPSFRWRRLLASASTRLLLPLINRSVQNGKNIKHTSSVDPRGGGGQCV